MAIEDMPPNAEGPDVSVQATLREGDHGLGIPRSAPVGARVLSRDEAREHHERQTDELRREFEQKLRQLDPAASFTWPAGVRRFLTWTVLAVASLLGLIVVGQGAALIRDIEGAAGTVRLDCRNERRGLHGHPGLADTEAGDGS